MRHWRIPALLALFVFLAGGDALAGTDSDFRPWGVGWGGWLGGSNGVGLRYRLPSGWAFTVAGYIGSSDGSSVDEDPDGYYAYSGQAADDSNTRRFAVEVGRSFALNDWLELAPSLHYVYSYSRSTSSYEELRVYDDPFHWTHSLGQYSRRYEDTWYGVGVRPRFWPHARVSVETGAFLDFRRSFVSYRRWTRAETNTDPPVEESSRSRDRENGWSWNLPTPSLNMGVILMFYF